MGWTSRRRNRCAAGPGASPAGNSGARAARCGRLPSPTRWACTSPAPGPAAARTCREMTGPPGGSGRMPGAQLGREGRTLRRVAAPEEGVVDEPGAFAGGGADLPVDDRPAGVIRRQVFDIPTITVRVVEHRLLARRCSCGTLTR